MIEPCWMWMKRRTTKKGAPSVRKTAELVGRGARRTFLRNKFRLGLSVFLDILTK
jgi:hypothetical protein